MNVLLLSRYSRMGASSRLRSLQYLPALKRAGLTVTERPFFDDAYLQALYSGHPMRGAAALRYLARRLRHLRAGPRPDVIWLEKEALPWLPWAIEQQFLPRGVPIVSDYDDAIFHRYDAHPRRAVRALLGSKIARVMAASKVVMAGNAYLATHAHAAGAPQVEIVPTVVDLDAYQPRPAGQEEAGLRLGWIGTPQTWAALARPIHAVLAQTLTQTGARFRAVGAEMRARESGTLEILPWSEAREVALIQSMDIGIMPLPDTPWTRGKCGYKLIQYMACGLPVIASPVGVNREIVAHGETGFLAESDAEWRTAATTLLNDADLRRRMGAAGRRKVEDAFSLQIWGPRVAAILRAAGEGRGPG